MNADFNELLERFRSATGPDRELDGLIEVEARRQEAYAIGLDDSQRAYWQTNAAGMVFEGGTIYAAPGFTASIDASLALVERMLPNTMKRVCDDENGDPRAELVTETLGYAREHGATWPLAILAALLSAIISKERTNAQ